MPDSMFDKLGDLLNDVLESGELPLSEEAVNTSESDSDNTNKNIINNNINTGCDNSEISRDNSTHFFSSKAFNPFKKKEIPVGEVIKSEKLNQKPSFPPEIIEALRILAITDFSKISKKIIRKQYLKLIKKAHPDAAADSITATQSEYAAKIINAYKLLEKYFTN